MNLMPLANRIEDAGVAVKGASLFLQMMPLEAETAVLLRSPLSGTPINHELRGYYRAEFQVIVRAHSYADGEALMQQVTDAITLAETVVENQTFQFCRARTLPVAFPLSKGNLLEFNVNFEAAYVEA